MIELRTKFHNGELHVFMDNKLIHVYCRKFVYNKVVRS